MNDRVVRYRWGLEVEEEAKGRLRRMRKRTRLGKGKGACWNICSSTLANSTVYSSNNSAMIATGIISISNSISINLFSSLSLFFTFLMFSPPNTCWSIYYRLLLFNLSPALKNPFINALAPLDKTTILLRDVWYAD